MVGKDGVVVAVAAADVVVAGIVVVLVVSLGGMEEESDDDVDDGKCDGSEARISMSKTRQSFPPLYESDSSSGL